MALARGVQRLELHVQRKRGHFLQLQPAPLDHPNRAPGLVYDLCDAPGALEVLERYPAVVGLIIYFLYIVDGCFLSMFLAGMHICELHLLAENKDLPEYFSIFKRRRKLIFYTMFIISMILAGAPSSSPNVEVLQNTPGWSYLAFLRPVAMTDFKWFYLFWAATFLVASVPHIPWLKGFFETPFCQYLGRISFALYLVHGPLLETVGERVYLAVGWEREQVADDLLRWVNIFPLPKGGPLGLEPSYLLPNLILLPITLWTAEVATNCSMILPLEFPVGCIKKQRHHVYNCYTTLLPLSGLIMPIC